MPRPRFLNVDLDIESAHSLRAILKDIGEKSHVLRHVQRPNAHALSIEIMGPTPNPDRAVNGLCRLIEHLGEAGRRAWERSHSRVFDIGWESAVGDRSRPCRGALAPKTVQRVARLGASIALTLYPWRDAPP